MKLPVMKTDPSPPSPSVLWGRFVEIRYDYEMAAAEQAPPELTVGRGVSGDSKPGLLLLTETAANDFVPAMEQAFEAANSMRPVVVEPASASNGQFLDVHRYVRETGRLLRLHSTAINPGRNEGLLVVSGRAALPALDKMAATSAAESARGRDLLRHLDDAQFDCILALERGRAIGQVGLQLRGQTGLITNWYVESERRRQGIGTMLLARSLELAARSQLIDVFAAVDDVDAEASHILEQSGFRTVCDFRQWWPPAL